MPESLKGKLLLAMPHLSDPNFARSVVLVLEHGPDSGALGVILNRPSDTSLGETLPSFEARAASPAVVFIGGPVAPTAAVCLARVGAGSTPEGWTSVTGPLGIVDLSRPIEETADGLDRVRVFAGYAGWGPGQLESELEEPSWFVLDADPEDALAPAPESLWAAVLRRQGGVMSWVALFPPDPALN